MNKQQQNKKWIKVVKKPLESDILFERNPKFKQKSVTSVIVNISERDPDRHHV